MAVLTSPTAQELISDVREDLGQLDENNSTWSNEQILRYLNEGVRRYFGEVVQNSEGHFAVQTDLNITANQETIALPTDCFEVLRLYKKIGDEYKLLTYDNSFISDYTTNGPSSSTSLFTYYFRGNSLVLRDVPTFSETSGLRLEYIQFPETMVYGGDSLTAQVAPVFKDLIIAYAVHKCKYSESIRGNGVDVVSPTSAQVSNLYAQFKQIIEERSHYPRYIKPWSPEDL